MSVEYVINKKEIIRKINIINQYYSYIFDSFDR